LSGPDRFAFAAGQNNAGLESIFDMEVMPGFSISGDNFDGLITHCWKIGNLEGGRIGRLDLLPPFPNLSTFPII
jgi:hypothetical protein